MNLDEYKKLMEGHDCSIGKDESCPVCDKLYDSIWNFKEDFVLDKKALLKREEI